MEAVGDRDHGRGQLACAICDDLAGDQIAVVGGREDDAREGGDL